MRETTTDRPWWGKCGKWTVRSASWSSTRISPGAISSHVESNIEAQSLLSISFPIFKSCRSWRYHQSNYLSSEITEYLQHRGAVSLVRTSLSPFNQGGPSRGDATNSVDVGDAVDGVDAGDDSDGVDGAGEREVEGREHISHDSDQSWQMIWANKGNTWHHIQHNWNILQPFPLHSSSQIDEIFSLMTCELFSVLVDKLIKRLMMTIKIVQSPSLWPWYKLISSHWWQLSVRSTDFSLSS